jgi:hypothetical protein
VVSDGLCGESSAMAQSRGCDTNRKEEKAYRLVEYGAILYRNQPDWLRKRHPLKRQAALSHEWEDGGRLSGIPGGEDQIRMFHPTIVIFDEAAFLPGFEACYNAANPVADGLFDCLSRSQWHFLYFFPEWHQHSSFLPILRTRTFYFLNRVAHRW